MQGRDARFYGAARRVTALGRATQRVAASAERARRTQRWWARRAGAAVQGHDGAGGTALVGAARGGAGGRGGRGSGGCCGAGAPLVGTVVRGRDAAGARQAAVRRCGDATLVTALELTAQQARWKRVTVDREEPGLARRNTPARVAAIRPNWRALPQRALRALR